MDCPYNCMYIQLGMAAENMAENVVWWLKMKFQFKKN
jgi:hypothetical protein